MYMYMLPYSEGSKCVGISVMQGSSYESSSLEPLSGYM